MTTLCNHIKFGDYLNVTDEGGAGIIIRADGTGGTVGISSDGDMSLAQSGTGNIFVQGLPTSDPGVTGALYQVAGVVMVSL